MAARISKTRNKRTKRRPSNDSQRQTSIQPVFTPFLASSLRYFANSSCVYLFHSRGHLSGTLTFHKSTRHPCYANWPSVPCTPARAPSTSIQRIPRAAKARERHAEEPRTQTTPAMDSHEGPSKGSAHHNNHTHNNAPAPPNPPSIEAAYKRKCIELKKRLNEVEAANDAMRIRNAQGHRYIQKMRLESCMLLERLAVLTGMAEEQGISTELRARTVALLKEMDPHYTPAAHANRGRGAGGAGEGSSSAGVKRASYGIDYMDDGTEGSSEGHPPTPQERPLRVKRSRRADDSTAHLDTPDKDIDLMNLNMNTSTTLPPLLPATRRCSPPTTHDLDSRIKQYNPPPVPISSSTAIDHHYNRQPPLAQSPTNHNNSHHHRHHSGSGNNFAQGQRLTSAGTQEPQHANQRYISAFEDFTNRTRDKVIHDLVDAYGPETNITPDDVDRALAEHWESLDPATKRQYGDRRESRDGLQ